MMTIYNVVPAHRFFTTAADQCASFPTIRQAELHVAGLKAAGDEGDYGIFEVRLIDGYAKMNFGRTMHARGGRRFVISKHYLGGFVAHDDGFGAEDASLYGYGPTPDAAIAECLENIAIAEERRAISATEKMEA